MNRYKPTDEEIATLKARGWRCDNDGWWWPADECGYGRTYREAMKESAHRENQVPGRLQRGSQPEPGGKYRVPAAEVERLMSAEAQNG